MRALRPIALVLAGFLCAPTPPPAHASFSDHLDDLVDFVDENLERLEDAVTRLEKRRKRALEKVERLAGKGPGDLARTAAKTKKVVSLIERAYACDGPDDVAAREVLDGLLDGLVTDLSGLSSDVLLGSDGIERFAADAAAKADRLLRKADELAARAAGAVKRKRRAKLIAKAARLAERARGVVRRSGGVTGPYDGVVSRTGTAAGVFTIVDGTASDVVGSLLTVSGGGELTSLRLESTFDDPAAGPTTLRVDVPAAALLAAAASGGLESATLTVGLGIDDVRVEVETGAGVVQVAAGTLVVTELDLRDKSLTAALDVILPGAGAALAATFVLSDFLLR